MKVYEMVTNDEYELVLASADTRVELAKKTGYSESNISRSLKRKEKNNSKIKFIEVEIDDD